MLRAEWTHTKSVSSAYWDPRGRSIVSTSYDDTIRCESFPPRILHAIEFIGVAVWDINSSALDSDDKFTSSRPFTQISHDCQTVRHSNISHLLNDPDMLTTGQMVDDPQSTVDTEPGRLPAFHHREHEPFPKHLLCERRFARKTLR